MEKYGMQLETTFGGVYAKISLEDFAALGYEFGDSVDFVFSNGKKVYDIPYFNGYYTRSGKSLLCGYQGYPYVYMSFNEEDGYWWTEGLKDEDTVSISLNEKGKYKDIQETFSLHYSNEGEDFDTEEKFANFRAIKGGLLKDNFLYRGASPVDNEYKRATAVDNCLKKVGIQYDVNLSDGIREIEKYQSEHVSPYFNELYANHKVVPMHMGAGFFKEKFARQLAVGIRSMLENDGPFFIHCVEGKDRTGFVVAVILSLAKASYQEIIDDYMITYDNYYGITYQNNPKKYMAIKYTKVDDYMYFLGNKEDGEDLSEVDFYPGARNYLLMGGLSEEEIDRFIQKICK